MTKLRCKFRLRSITEYQPGQPKRYSFDAAISQDTPENERFTRYTPSGTLEVTIDNPLAAEMLKPGQDYYLDVVPADSPPKA